MEQLNISNNDYTKILIDDLVENDPKYKAKVKNIIEKVKIECKEDADCIKNAYNDPNTIKTPKNIDLLKEFGDSYFEVRKSKGCGTDNSNDDSKQTCDDLNDQNLKKAVTENKRVVFESTGSYIPTWLLNKEYITDEYNIVFSYTLVNLKQLIKRNKSRAITSIQKFNDDNNNPAPRLPDISEEKFGKAVLQIKTTLIDLFNSCIKDYENNTEKCGEKK